MPLLAHHAQADSLGRAEHALHVAVSALARVDVDQVPPGYARRLARLRTDAAALAHELAGPRVTYQRDSLIVHGRYIADLSTHTTVAIRGSDGYIVECSTLGKFNLRRRSLVTRRAAAA